MATARRRRRGRRSRCGGRRPRKKSPWPDWRGDTVVIGASGPSQTRADLERAKGRARVIVTNETWRLAPWADVLYGHDAKWWERRAPEEFQGLRISAGVVPGVCTYDWGERSRGGNSGYQAICLAQDWGAKRIILTGFDMQGTHWHGLHGDGLNNPPSSTIANWITALEKAAPAWRDAGLEIINASRETALTCFPLMSIEDALNITDARAAEHAKYARCYEAPRYRMGRPRMNDAIDSLVRLPTRGSYLDVSTGRGEMLENAKSIAFSPVRGTEVTAALVGGLVSYAEAHALPFEDGSYDVVSMFDVIEHLLPGDDELACRELARVARKHVVITANNRPSFNSHGDDLHINKRPYDEWDALFREWFPGNVTRLPLREYVSETWRVDL